MGRYKIYLGSRPFSDVIQVNHEAVASLLATIWGSWDAGQVHGDRKGGAGGRHLYRLRAAGDVELLIFSTWNCSLWIGDSRADRRPFWRGQQRQVATAGVNVPKGNPV